MSSTSEGNGASHKPPGEVIYAGIIVLCIAVVDFAVMRYVENIPAWLVGLSAAIAVLIAGVAVLRKQINEIHKHLSLALLALLGAIYSVPIVYAYTDGGTSRITNDHVPSADEIADAVIHKQSPFPAVPTANEIANAVLQRLPKQVTGQTQPNTAVSATAPYVNPLHDKVTKWQIAAGLRSGILHGNLSQDCKITIIRLQITYAEDYAAELKSILDVVGWKYEERFATSTLEKGLTVRSPYAQGKSRDCAEALSGRIRNDGHTRNGGSPNTLVEWLSDAEIKEYAKDPACASGCVEVDFGNEDILQ